MIIIFFLNQLSFHFEKHNNYKPHYYMVVCMWHTHIEKTITSAKNSCTQHKYKHDDVMMVKMLIILMRMTKVATMLIMAIKIVVMLV